MANRLSGFRIVEGRAARGVAEKLPPTGNSQLGRSLRDSTACPGSFWAKMGPPEIGLEVPLASEGAMMLDLC